MAAAQKRARLYYFKGRGKAEMTRLTCAAAGIEFDEVNIGKREQYLKVIDDGKLLFKQLPLFEIDGQQLVGSDSIVRHLARKTDLYGNTNDEKTRIDILMMGAKDLADVGVGGAFYFDPNPEKALEEKVIPVANNKYLPAFEKTLAANGSGFLVGRGLTIADILLFDTLTQITDSTYPRLVSVLDNYPKCKAFVGFIGSQPGIKEYLSSPRRYPVPTPEYISTVKETLGW